MSADNVIYILKTGKQYRVAHLSYSRILYWDAKHRHYSDEMCPDQVIDAFGQSKFTYSAEKAFRIGWAMQKQIGTEYGVVLLDAEKSWEEIVKEAKK